MENLRIPLYSIQFLSKSRLLGSKLINPPSVSLFRCLSSPANNSCKLQHLAETSSTATNFLQAKKFCQKPDDLKTKTNSAETTVDAGPGTWKEVYKGLLSSQVKLVKSFSLGTSLIGLSIQPVIINYLGSSMSLLLSFSTLIGMFTFVTPALIHMFTRKYVFRLEYDEKTDQYAATTLSFFLREKTIRFRPSDVTIPGTPRMFTTFIVNKKPLFVDMETFQDIEHFGRIMGYDKPMDLYKYHKEK